MSLSCNIFWRLPSWLSGLQLMIFYVVAHALFVITVWIVLWCDNFGSLLCLCGVCIILVQWNMEYRQWSERSMIAEVMSVLTTIKEWVMLWCWILTAVWIWLSPAAVTNFTNGRGRVQHQSSVVTSCPGYCRAWVQHYFHGDSPNRPVTTAELVLITATVIKLNLLLSEGCLWPTLGPPSLFVSGLTSIVENSVCLDNSVKNALCPGKWNSVAAVNDMSITLPQLMLLLVPLTWTTES